jgi:hypothetical protein
MLNNNLIYRRILGNAHAGSMRRASVRKLDLCAERQQDGGRCGRRKRRPGHGSAGAR